MYLHYHNSLNVFRPSAKISEYAIMKSQIRSTYKFMQPSLYPVNSFSTNPTITKEEIGKKIQNISLEFTEAMELMSDAVSI